MNKCKKKKYIVIQKTKEKPNGRRRGLTNLLIFK